jgi:hypothetical protein
VVLQEDLQNRGDVADRIVSAKVQQKCRSPVRRSAFSTLEEVLVAHLFFLIILKAGVQSPKLQRSSISVGYSKKDQKYL